MKKIISFVLVAVSLSACGDQYSAKPTACVQEMRAFFSEDLKCPDAGGMETHLYQAEYEGQLIYFTEIMCIYCGVAPVTAGYNCSKEKVEFRDKNKLTNIKRVYDSCEDKFL